MTVSKYKGKQLALFWTRLIGWIGFTAGAPITTFALKFGLFEENGYIPEYDEMGNITNQPVALNGWGIVCCLIVGWTIIQMLKELRKANPEYSMMNQCLYGLQHRIIPLCMGFVMVYYLNGVLDNILWFLGTMIISQAVAIPLNPMPKWRKDTRGISDYNDLYSELSKIIKQKMSKNKEESK